MRSWKGACIGISEVGSLDVAGNKEGERTSYRQYPFALGCHPNDPCAYISGAVRLEEAPGLQLRLRSWVHSDEITALSYSPSLRAVVAGDRAGGISLLDMLTPGVLWYNDGAAGPVTAVQLGMCALPSRKDK